MNVIIIQPPLVQLNTAYPAGAYLASFFRSMHCDAVWYDLSIELFYELFSRDGLTELFAKSMPRALGIAEKARRQGDEATSSNIYRYISQRSRWISWIDTITAILRDGGSTSGRELCHRFIFSPHAPRGSRMETFLDGLGREPTTDDARFLASMALADLADYITAVFDREFALIRYGESLAISETSFAQIEKGLDSPVLIHFYERVLEKRFRTLTVQKDEKTLICISVPFAGTFAAALYTARYFRQHHKNAFIVFGGGFVNTELRDTQETALAAYIDAISYDRGYGSYHALMKSGLLQGTERKAPVQLYKMRLFSKGNVAAPLEHDEEAKQLEDSLTSTLIPDYKDIDFSRYPRMLDDQNPMQRLWSDGAWIKAYLAHGCYWHQCAFCDTTLDYVYGYRLTRIQELFKGLKHQAQDHGVYGIHFVDEALPPLAVTQFATLNAAAGSPLTFWGNVRFEKTFTRDVAEFLSFGGLTGVSAGIEIATGSGLDEIHKGTDIDSIVGACCAFKESGILVHAYMIYGYWQESEQDLINSMETLRQFYAAGLLDSSFWHKFTLTRHSRIYDEWKNGKHTQLCPVEPKDAGIFARNGMHFSGEQKSQKFGNGLNAALHAWMHGEALQKNVCRWFSFKTPQPTIPQDLIEKAIARYEQRRDASFSSPVILEKSFWLGGDLLLTDGGSTFTWEYMDELHELEVPKSLRGEKAAMLSGLLHSLQPESRNSSKSGSSSAPQEVMRFLGKFRGRGLVQLPWNL